MASFRRISAPSVPPRSPSTVSKLPSLDVADMAYLLGEFDDPCARPVFTGNEVEEGDACWLAARSEAAVSQATGSRVDALFE